MEPVQGKLASSQFDFGYTEQFCIPGVTSVFFSSCDSVVGILWSSIKPIEGPYVFDWENTIALDTLQWNRASSRREGNVSCVFFLKWNRPRDALTQKTARFPSSGLNAGSYIISQDEGMTESPVETLEKAIVLHLFWTEGLTSF